MKHILLIFAFTLYLNVGHVTAQPEHKISSNVIKEMQQVLGEGRIYPASKNMFRWRITNPSKRSIQFKEFKPGTGWVDDNIEVNFVAKNTVERVALFWSTAGNNTRILNINYGKYNQNNPSPLKHNLTIKPPRNSCDGPWDLILAVKIDGDIYYKKKSVGVVVYDCGTN